MSDHEFTHFETTGASRMVDVAGKEVTARRARAVGFVHMEPHTLRKILDRDFSKGDVFEVARLAGIMAAKRTSDLIPHCHPLPLDSIQIAIEPDGETSVRIEATVGVTARTGVEMEALTAVSVSALTIYDMCKSVDRGMSLGPIELLEKEGGRSGHFIRENLSTRQD